MDATACKPAVNGLIQCIDTPSPGPASPQSTKSSRAIHAVHRIAHTACRPCRQPVGEPHLQTHSPRHDPAQLTNTLRRQAGPASAQSLSASRGNHPLKMRSIDERGLQSSRRRHHPHEITRCRCNRLIAGPASVQSVASSRRSHALDRQVVDKRSWASKRCGRRNETEQIIPTLSA